ncbi:MAG: DUF58 domain-containing protein [Phycisphaerales bacterium]|nr:DUF58 domain-containing protein [Phycisphaerales bacterium]
MQSPSATSVQLPNKKQRRESTLPGTPHTRRSSSLTPPGFLFVFVTLFLALGAINGQNNLLFWLFGFSIAALIVSGIITGTALIAIRITAHPLEQTELGTTLKPRYTIHNTSRLYPNFALEIIELDTPTPAPPKSIPAIALHIRPKTHTKTQSQIIPETRGLLTLSKIKIRSHFPFGLFTKSIDFNIPRQALILPRSIPVNQSTLDRLTATDESETRSLNRKGTGLDYFALRQYQPGDPLRNIAWKQSARTSTLLVTEYPEPATDQLALQLLAPESQTPDHLFEHAISLTYSILKSVPTNTRVALSIPWASISIPPSTGQAHINRCARALAFLTKPSSAQKIPPTNHRKDRPITIGYTKSKNTTPADLYAEDFTPNQTQ